MIDFSNIRGFLFDYGGTVDSNGIHWSEIIWQAYQQEKIPVSKEIFRNAYIYGEQMLGKNPLIKPHHTFLDMMRLKTNIQIEWLKAENHLPQTRNNPLWENNIADYCYGYAHSSVEKAYPIIERISKKYKLALVSNFYGNIAAVLKDFQLDRFFPIIIESAVVGIRKPDPQIFRLGVEALQLSKNEIVVIGDSYDKDIIPATTLGCRTIWLKNTGWNDYTGNETADWIISDFPELEKIVTSDKSTQN
jgi:putative hydrolase of the HAD superfamily